MLSRSRMVKTTVAGEEREGQRRRDRSVGTVIAVIVTFAVFVGTVGYLLAMLVKNVRDERRSSNIRNLWGNFGLTFTLLALFLVTWIGQGIVQWAEYAQDQRTHNAPVEISGYIIEFSQSTLENWQSEFLQLFSFVLLSAVLIHRGSAESKDSDDRMEQMLKRIEKKVGAT
jgi:uncharacterized membrane protein YhaH (DUF805 family)